mgnify:CR=1 FL=1
MMKRFAHFFYLDLASFASSKSALILSMIAMVIPPFNRSAWGGIIIHPYYYTI